MSEKDNLSDLETIWADLRGLLEWQEGFGLYLIFSQDVDVAKSLLRSLWEWCAKHRLRIQVVRPLDHNDALAKVLAALSAKPDLPGTPLWLEFDSRVKDGGWDAVRRQVLTALNQRRSWLEQEYRQPLFIQLPHRFAAEMVTWAPDLWSVKRYVAVLPGKQDVLESLAADLKEEDMQTAQTNINWVELVEKYHVAVPQQDRPQAMRDLAVYIANKKNDRSAHDIASDMVYALDSLALFRYLRKLFGDTPQVLTDVADALRRVAWVKKADQNYIGAIKALHVSLGLRFRLLTMTGYLKEALLGLIALQEELAFLEEKVGNSARARAWLKHAQALKAELTDHKPLSPVLSPAGFHKPYSDSAFWVLIMLPLKTQMKIEYLRTNILQQLVHTNQAHISNNMVLPVEYWSAFPAIDVRLFYYEEHSRSHEIVIFNIEHPIKNLK